MRAWLLRSIALLLPLAACTSILGVDGEYEAGGGGASTSSSATSTASATASGGGGGSTTGTTTATGTGTGGATIACDEAHEPAFRLPTEAGTSRARPAYAYGKMRFAHLVEGPNDDATIWSPAGAGGGAATTLEPEGDNARDAVLIDEIGLLVLEQDGVNLWGPEFDEDRLVRKRAVGEVDEDAGPPLFAVRSNEGDHMVAHGHRNGVRFLTCTSAGECAAQEEVDCITGDGGGKRRFGFIHGAPLPNRFWLCGTTLSVQISEDTTEETSLPSASDDSEVAMALAGLPVALLIVGGQVALRLPGETVRFESSAPAAPTLIVAGERLFAAWEDAPGIVVASCPVDSSNVVHGDQCECRTLADVAGNQPFLEPSEVEENAAVLGFTDVATGSDRAAKLVVTDLIPP